MKKIIALTLLAFVVPSLLLGQGAARKHSAKLYPGKTWEKVKSPEDLGWSSEKLKLAREYSEEIGSAGVMIVADGIVLDEWGETARRFNIHSIRKSFLSALYGIYVNEKKIKLSSTMADLKIDDNEPSLTDEEKKARVSDLLKARSGIYHPALYETPGMKAARPKRHSHKPGSFWYYNNWDFNALGTIFEQSTELSISQAFKQRIAERLEMEDYRLEDTQYVRGDDSIHPAYPFRMTARDMARFGLLFLRQGEWRGKQIVPRSWIAESTRSYSDAGPSGGYGYMWWVAANGRHLPQVSLKDGAYSARGAGGHFILVIPDLDLVIVHRVNTYLPGKSVGGNQFGSLVKMILDAKTDEAKPSR